MKKSYLLIAMILLLIGVVSSAGVWRIPSGTAEAGMVIGSGATGGGGGGPDTWYYPGADSSFETSVSIGTGGREIGNLITMPSGSDGTITHVGVRLNGTDLPCKIKVLLNDVQQDCVETGTISPSAEWADVELTSSFAVEENDEVVVAITVEGGFTCYRRTTGTGTYRTGITYSTYCNDSFVWSDDANYYYGVRVYSD